jgi:hypothetical protein
MTHPVHPPLTPPFPGRGTWRATIAALLLLAPAPALADALVDNVTGVRLDRNGRVQRFNALLLSPDGKVVRHLQARDKRPEKLDWRADMKGRVMMPGFVDAHGHVMGLGLRAMELDLSAARTLAEAQTMIAAYVQANPDRKWITGGGWNQERWGLGRFPTAAELDQVAGDRPVFLERADGHAGWASSAAMRAAGVTAATASPAGGRIEQAGGRPSGVFVDAAMQLVTKAIPQPIGKERDSAFLRAQQILLSSGVTATADMGTSLDDWMTFRRIADQGYLRVRVISYGAGVEDTLRIGGTGPTPWLYNDKLRLVGVKLYGDGALGSRGAWLKSPYADAPGESGLGFTTDAQLKNLMSRAAMDGYQVAVHAIGDRANGQVLGAVEELALTYKGDRRWRVEHAQVVDPADLKRFGRNGVIASMQPVHQTSDRTMAEARLGPARLAGAYAWRSMLANGSRLAFGSDYPVEKPDPFAGWAAAFTRTDADGQPIGGWRPEEALTREQAWRGFTTDAAYAGFAEAKFGGLEVGQRADFIIVDRDPMLAGATELRQTRVLETWVGGEKVWERR